MIDESGLRIKPNLNIGENTLVKIGECEYEMIQLFRKINVSRPVALTIACLSKGKEISSQNIEMVSGLRQPEVSVAMRYLRENNWIDIREEKRTEGKGRPVKLYRLAVTMDRIVNKIEEKIIAESMLARHNIQCLKSLA